MYRILSIFLCLSLLLGSQGIAGDRSEAAAAAGNSTNTTNTAVPAAVISLEEQVFLAVNRIREENGLPLLSWGRDLTEVARTHSQDMAQREYLSHVTPEGDNLLKRIGRGGIVNWSRLSENLASNFGFSDPAAVAIKGWLESPAHRQNIFDRNVTETGIGVAFDAKGKVYLTQLFVKRRS